MKGELKIKFLQYLNKLTIDDKSGLINLLILGSITLALIGILPAIALSSYLSQLTPVNLTARQTEARQIINTMNKAQQVYYLEFGEFVTTIADVDKLGISIKTSTANYTYDIVVISPGKGIANLAKPAPNSPLLTYVGGVSLIPVPSDLKEVDLTTGSIVCKSLKPGIPATPKAIALTPQGPECLPPFVPAK